MPATNLIQFIKPSGTPAADGYSQAAVIPSGRMVLISGQVGADENWVLETGFEAQADRTFTNLQRTIEDAGGGLANIAKLTIYVTDASELGVYCAVRDRYFVSDPRPASTFIAVKALYAPEALIEIEALAVL